MRTKLKIQLRILQWYNVVVTLAMIAILTMAFKSNYNDAVKVLNVQRLNIVDASGHIAMALGAKGQLPGPMMGGKEYNHQQRSAGVLFFNEDGDECGGYSWGSDKSGSAGAAFAFDQYKQDQLLSMIYQESPGSLGDAKKKRLAGFSVNPEPSGIRSDSLNLIYSHARSVRDTKRRKFILDSLEKKYYQSPSLFVGTKWNEDIGVFIVDAKKKPRLRLFTDKAGNPKLQFLDSLGKVILTLPEKTPN